MKRFTKEQENDMINHINYIIHNVNNKSQAFEELIKYNSSELIRIAKLLIINIYGNSTKAQCQCIIEAIWNYKRTHQIPYRKDKYGLAI
jgi:hypothetical protein